jgi:N-hydroxyarylamine O-acetyltransferase
VFDESLVAAYLAHLGVEREPPSVAALDRLVVAHLDRVPFETTWMALGERWALDPVAAARRIVGAHRGGYCFILNDAFGTLLTSLGYSVTRHVGGVHAPAGVDEANMTNHLVLLVDLHDDGRWYVEAGMGDGPVGAVPLQPLTLDQPPYRYDLRRTTGVADWDLAYGPAGGEAIMAMAFREAPVAMDAFATRHVHLSTSPESGFVRVPTAQRRRRDRLTIVRACTVTRADAHGADVTVVDARADWYALLADEFGLTYAGVAPAALDRLWSVVEASHAAHLAGQAAAEAGGTVTG